MKVKVTVKEVNPEFDQQLADKYHEGKESEDNIRYNWEDEFDVSADITDFRIRNNAVYMLEGFRGEEKFSYEIPSMTIVECVAADGSITPFAASRRLIKDTKKTVGKNGDIHFFLFLKGGHPMVNPVTGVYISKGDFPFELPEPEEEEITGDEEE